MPKETLFKFIVVVLLSSLPVLAKPSSYDEDIRVGNVDDEKEVIVVKTDVDENDEAWLGVQIKELNREMREDLDVDTKRGVVVMDVVEDSPAERAGLEKDDVIIKFDGRTISRTSDLTRAIHRHEIGDNVKVEVMRGQEKLEMDVELDERPNEFDFEFDIPNIKKSYRMAVHGLGAGQRLGVQLQELDADLAEYFGTEPGNGVLITEVEDDGTGEKAGLKSGDVILSVDEKKVENLEDLAEVLDDYDEGDVVELTVLRKEQTKKMSVELEEDNGLARFYFKNGKVRIPHVEIYKYKDALDRYKDAMELEKDQVTSFKEDMKRWKDEYRKQMEEHIRHDVEKELDKQKLELETLKDELKQMRKQILELEKKVM